MVFKRAYITQKTFMLTSMPFTYVGVLGRSLLFAIINLKDFERDPTKQGAFEKKRVSVKQKGLKKSLSAKKPFK